MLYDRGYKITEIARKTELSRASIYRVLCERKIQNKL